MMMLTVAMVVMVAVTAVRAAFGLERNLYLHELRSETVEHILDHMVWANAKGIIPNLGWKMAISQVPSEAHQLMAVLMLDFDDRLGGRLNP
jgi:ABC-type antimicrobial peptide transport system permease subunit